MKQGCKHLRGLRYKLRMSGPCYISGDNQSVLANTTEPGSTLKKKSQSITYHLFVRALPMTNGGLVMSTLMKMRLIC
jgi:hypothetical protein